MISVADAPENFQFMGRVDKHGKVDKRSAFTIFKRVLSAARMAAA